MLKASVESLDGVEESFHSLYGKQEGGGFRFHLIQHRFIYIVDGNQLTIISCRYHYEK